MHTRIELSSSDALFSRGRTWIVGDDHSEHVLRFLASEDTPSDGYAVFIAPTLERFYTESNDESNDSFETPEVLPTPPEPTPKRLPSLFGRIGSDDVDHFAIDVLGNAERPDSVLIQIQCFGQEIGSNVRGLDLRLLSPDGSTIVRVEEGFNPVERISVALLLAEVSPGRHVLRIAADSEDPELSSSLYVCQCLRGCVEGR